MSGKSDYKKGMKLFEAEDYDNAINKLEKAIESSDLNDNDLYSAFVTVGACYNKIGAPKGAIEALEAALLYKDNDYRAYNEFANTYFANHNNALAFLFFDKAIECSSNKVEICLNRVKRLYNFMRYEEAEKILNTALKYVSPSDSKVIDIINQIRFMINLGKKRLLASDLYLMDERDDAIKLYEFILESLRSKNAPKFTDEIYREYVKPIYVDSLECKAECMHVMERYDSEIEAYKELLEIFPDDAKLYEKIANCYVELNKFDEALGYYTKAEDFTEDKDKKDMVIGEKHLTFFGKFVKDKNYQAALDYVNSLPETNDEEICFKKVLLGRAYFYLENYDEALNNLLPYVDDERLDAFSGDTSGRGIANTYAGGAYYKKKTYKIALKYLKKSIDIKFDVFADTWLFMGECYIALGKYKKAIEALETAADTVDEFTTYNIPYVESRIKFAKEKGKGNENDDKLDCTCSDCGAKVGANDLLCKKCGNLLK